MATYRFGKSSERRLLTIHPGPVLVVREAIALGLIDFGIIHGFRGKELQNQLFRDGDSEKPWPESKHNILHPTTGKPWSGAFDIAIYIDGQISWKKEYYVYAAGMMQACGKELGIPLRWGGNWDMDGEPLTDQKFQDLGHFERIIKEA